MAASKQKGVLEQQMATSALLKEKCRESDKLGKAKTVSSPKEHQ